MGPAFMALFLIVGWGIFAYSALRRWKLMMVGAPAARFDQPGKRLATALRYAFGQLRMPRYPASGWAHILVFVGFMVLLLRSLMLWGRGFDEPFDLWILGTDNVLGQAYAFLKDLFAVLVIIGALIFLYVRSVKKLQRLTHSTEALIILLIILVMMVADILYDGAAIAQHTEGDIAFAVYEPAGSAAAIVLDGLSDGALGCLKHVGF